MVINVRCFLIENLHAVSKKKYLLIKLNVISLSLSVYLKWAYYGYETYKNRFLKL